MAGEYSPARAIALGKADVIGITTYYATTYYEPDGWLLIDQRADIWVGSVGVGGLGGERGCGRRLAGALRRWELLAAATSAPSPPGGGWPQRPRAGRRRGGGVSAREKWSRQGGWQAEAEGVGGRGGGERRRGVGRASERKGGAGGKRGCREEGRGARSHSVPFLHCDAHATGERPAVHAQGGI